MCCSLQHTSAHLFHQPFLLRGKKKSSRHPSISLTPWFPSSCFSLRHTLPTPQDSLQTLLSVLLSTPTVAPSLLPQWHVLSGYDKRCCILSEVWSFELGRDQLFNRCHLSSVGVAQLSLTAAAVTMSFLGSVYSFLWAYTANSQTISMAFHLSFLLLFFLPRSFSQIIFTKVCKNADDLFIF